MSFGDINNGPAKDYGTTSYDKGPCWIITDIEGTTVSYAAAPPKIATLVFIKWHRRCTCDLWSALDAEGNLPWHHSGGVFPAGTLQWDTGGPISISLHTGGRDGVIGDDPTTLLYDESADDVNIKAQKWDFKFTTRISKSGECAEDGKKYGDQAPGCGDGGGTQYSSGQVGNPPKTGWACYRNETGGPGFCAWVDNTGVPPTATPTRCWATREECQKKCKPSKFWRDRHPDWRDPSENMGSTVETLTFGGTEGESGGGYCPPTPVDGFVPCCLDACGVYCNGFGCKEEQTPYGTGNNGGGANNDENCNMPPTKCFQDGTAGIMLSGNDPTEAVRETLSNFINGDSRSGGDPNSEKNFCKKECDNGGSRGRGR